MSNFYESIENYSGKHLHKMKKICEPLFRTFGVNLFFQQSVTPDGKYFSIGTNPDFAHFYFDLEFYKCNPFIINSEGIEKGIHIFDSVGDRDFQSTMDIAEKKHNIKHVLMIVEKEDHICNEYGFCLTRDDKNLAPLLINEIPLLKQFILFFSNDETIGRAK